MEFLLSLENLPAEQKIIRAKCFHPSGTFVEFGKEEIEQSIPSRFEKIVAKYPERMAVKTRSHEFTYDTLNQFANRIAQAILAKQGPAWEPIALMLEHGAPMIGAILGVLKAGKTYVPLDSTLPRSRIASMLEELQASLIVTNNQSLPLTKELAPDAQDLLNIDEIDSSFSIANPDLPIQPDTLAYILYTSGSTGQPKGVTHNHRNVMHDCMAYTNNLHFCPNDRLTLLHSCSFSASKHYLFGALLNGAAIYPFDIKREGLAHLSEWLTQEKITIYHSGVVVYRYFLDTLTGKEKFPNLRLIKLGSQQVSTKDVEWYKKQFSAQCILVNTLSCTEAGTVRWHFMDKGTEINVAPVPVGHGVEDMEIVLLDDDGKEVDINQTGEIVIKSRYLALGYWRQPDLTQAKFLSDPSGGDKRIYMTGDLGRMLPDGCLIQLGRKDFQVKIRGYRVEVGEIEMAMADHPKIKAVAVVTHRDLQGDNCLVAYAVPDQEQPPTIVELRRFLREKLPDYMVPSAFVFLSALPLTPNGKIDRRALPIPDQAGAELQRTFAAPRTPLEKVLARIWAEVLKFEQVGVDDNFFDLGGHSLLATQVVSRVREALQVELPLRALFENPTVTGLALQIAQDQAKRTIAEEAINPPAGRDGQARPPQDGAESLSIQPAPRDGKLHLSFAQHRLWFLNQLEPASFAYNLFSAFRLAGRLNVTALEQSFNEIIWRHEALRTVFKTVDGQPQQIILSSVTTRVPVVDLRGIVSDAERESEVRRLSTAEAQRPFDLARGPLLRATLLCLTEDEHILLLSIHHIVFDGWSMGILAREIAALYKAFSSGRPSTLPALPIQYADFAVWQRQSLRGEVLAAQLAYWRKQLEGLTTLRLPFDRPRPPVPTGRGMRQYFVLSKTLSERLKSLSNQHKVTLFMTLLAAYQTLLHRYTGENDIVTGSPVAGRNHRVLESMIGFFLNMLVLRIDFSGNPTFRELLGRMRTVCLEAYAHQDLSFEKLVEELQPERDLSHNPLFQVTFAFHNTPRFPLELPSLTTTELEVDPGIARFDLHLFIEEKEGGLQGYADYNSDLFDAAIIQRLLGHLQTLLKGIVANPDERVGSLPLLTEAERCQLLIEWNDTKKEYPKDKCIHELFETQAEETPEAVALIFEEKYLTYQELNRRANQLAPYLRKLGTGPETLVGICVERSPDMVVALLGVLKAGGAYVPVDPRYPPERVALMLQDTRLLLTTSSVSKKLPPYNRRTICLDAADGEDVSGASVENPARTAAPENLAYVIHTSGSTGAPKAVGIAHGSAVALLHWAKTVFAPEDLAGVLASSSICFDLSVFELFLPLCCGGAVILAEDTMHLPILAAAKEVTLINSVPSAVYEMLAAGELPPSVHVVNLAGEPLATSLVKQLYERTKAARVYDLYGPSETTTYSSFALRTAGGAATIGRPIANTRIYLLDAYFEPVPVGVAGDLHIGGAGVARGYLNAADLTAEKFVPDPFSDAPGARLYKTGDRARFHPDGNIEFLGRLDDQVKIRGFRVELGEIETALRQHAAVRAAVVTARETNPLDASTELRAGPRLVAYLVCREAATPSLSALREFLRAKLPDYMIPSNFVFLDALPLTATGKVDRRALPTPDQTRPKLENDLVAPRSPIEKMLAGIWMRLLGLEQIGVHDNFFELGGHSLLATQVLSRIRKAFQVELSLRTFFEASTVAGIANIIQRAEESAAENPTPKISPILREPRKS
jgi:amino acid adenylation domain-containing protein